MRFVNVNISFDSEKVNKSIVFYWFCSQIFHYSVDQLIGLSRHHASSSKLCHKFGFSNTEEFENAVKNIASLYRQYVLHKVNDAELTAHFSHFNHDFQQCVLEVIRIRRIEVEDFLVNEHNARQNDLLASFDWDVRWIMGTNKLPSSRSQIVTLILNCKENQSSDSKTKYMEMNRDKLNQLIEVLEECDRKLSAN